MNGYNPTQQGKAPSTERVDYSQVDTPKDYNYKGYGSGNYTDTMKELNDKAHGKDDIAKDYAEAVKGAKGTKGDHFTLDGSDKGRDDAYAASVEAAKEAVKKAGARTPEEVSKILDQVGQVNLDKDAYKELFADMRDAGSGYSKDAIGAKYAGEGAYVIDGWTNDAIFDPSIIKREIEVNRHCKYLGIPGEKAASGSAMPYTFEGTTAAVQKTVSELLSMREQIIAATEGGHSNLKRDFAQVVQTLDQAMEYFSSGQGIQQVTEAMDAPVQAANAAVMGINTEGMGYKQEYGIAAPIIKKLHATGMNPAGIPGMPPNAAVEELVTAALEAGIEGGSNMETVLQDAGEIANRTAQVVDDSKDFNPDISDGKNKDQSAPDGNPEDAKTETSQGGSDNGKSGSGQPTQPQVVVTGGGGGGGGVAPRPVGGGAGGGGGVGSNRGGAGGGGGKSGGRSDEERKSAAEKLADLIAGKDGDKDDDKDKDKDKEKDKEKEAKDRLDEMLEEKGIEVDDEDDDKDSDDKDSDDKDSDDKDSDDKDSDDKDSRSDVAGDIDDLSGDIDGLSGSSMGDLSDGTAGTAGTGTGTGADTGAGLPGAGAGTPGSYDGSGADLGADTGAAGLTPDNTAAQQKQDELGRKLADATHLTGGSADATGLRDNLARSGSGLGSMAGGREPAGAAGGAGAGAGAGAPAGAMMGAAGAAPAGAAGGMSGSSPSATPGSPAHGSSRVPGTTGTPGAPGTNPAAAQAQAEAQRKAAAEQLASDTAEKMRASGQASAEQVADLLNGDIETGLGSVSAVPEGGYLNYGEYLDDPFDARKGDIVSSPVGTGVYDGDGHVDLEDGRRIPINQMLQLSPPEYGVFRPESEPADLSADQDEATSEPKRAMPQFDSHGYASAAAEAGSDPFAGSADAGQPVAETQPAQPADMGGTGSGSGMGGLNTAAAPAGDTSMSSGSSDPFAHQAPAHQESAPAPAPEPQQPEQNHAPQPQPQQPEQPQQPKMDTHHAAPVSSSSHDVHVTADNTTEGHATDNGPRNTTGTGFAHDAAASSVSEDRVREHVAAAESSDHDNNHGGDHDRGGDHGNNHGGDHHDRDVRPGADHGGEREHGDKRESGNHPRPGAGDNPESAGRDTKSRPAQEFVAADDRTPNQQPTRPQPKGDASGIREVDYEGRPLGE